MKGTVGRGRWYEEDRAQAEWLRQSEKNRAENLMIVDMVRNDMGRLAAVGSVTVPRLFALEPYPTLWQMTSTVQGVTDAGLAAVFSALFPAASITGAPKIRTMEIIADLESAPRRIYTGTVGFVAPDGRAQFNVAIRTVLVDRETAMAEFGVGGGVVWDSEEASEFAECRVKARVLSHVQPEFQLLETLLWEPGSGYFLFEEHLQRLAQSAAYFGRPVDLEAVRRHLGACVDGLPPLPHRVRLLVANDGTAATQCQPVAVPDRPPRICLARTPVNTADVFLYHKTTARDVYEKALAACPGMDDVLLWNERGEITESTIANVVVALDGALCTPPVSCGLLGGVFREWLLRQGNVSERVIRVEDLPRCSAVYLVNSVRRMRQATLVES